MLPVHLGPRAEWFTAAARQTLLSGVYRVSPASNRIGLRTDGPALERADGGELPSEGMPWVRCRCHRRAVRCSSSPITR